MTDSEVLKKAISKAVKNGFYEGKVPPEMILESYKTWVDGKLAIGSLIFSHDFAKAFWGEEEICTCGRKLFEVTRQGADCEVACEENHKDRWIEAWQFHLQQMVLEENPIKYLEKFIKE